MLGILVLNDQIVAVNAIIEGGLEVRPSLKITFVLVLGVHFKS